jgi:aspartyl-tRNA(Asn)/glutamyl-tRNA(Gln) amidotransferase subunit A
MVEQRKRPGRCSVFGLSGAADEPLSAAVDAARRAGIEVQTVEATWDAAALRRLCLLIVEVEALAEHSGVLTKNPDGFSPPLRSLLAWAARQAAPKVAQAYRDLAAAASGLREHLRPFDAVLTPATPGPAFSFDDAPPINQADFTMLANIAGFAATAFPVGATPDGLPLSLQVISESDETALDLAERLALPAPTPPAFRA